CVEFLAALARRDEQDRGLDAGLLERVEEPRAVAFGHDVVADDDDPRPRQQLGAELARAIDQPGTDGDVVAAAGQVDAHRADTAHAAAPAGCGARCLRNASITCSVVMSAGCAVDSTIRSASA